MKTNIVKILLSLLTALALLAGIGALAENGGEAPEPRQALSLWVNGDTPEELSILTQERFYLRVSLPEETTMARVVEEVDGEVTDMAYLFDWDKWGEKLADGSWGWQSRYSDPDDFTLYAQVTTDDIDWDELDWATFDWDEDVAWSQTSNAVTIHVSGDGAVGESEITVPETVTRGEPLTVNVDQFGEDVGWLWCEVYYVDADGERHSLYDNCVELYRPNTTGSIGTANLEPGDYGLHISNVPAEAGRLEAYQTLEFKVTEPDGWGGDAFLFRVDPSEDLFAHQSVALSAHREGADEIRVMKDDGERIEEIAYRSRDTLVQECGDLGEGRFELYAEALVDEKWVKSDTVTVDVTADKDFEGYALDAPAIADPDEDYTFTVKNLGVADDWWWDITVNRIVEDDDWPCVYRVTANDMSAAAAEGVITVPGDVLEGDTGYEIRVNASARRIGDADLTGRFYVTGNKSDVVLTASYGGETSTEAISLPSFDEFTLSVKIPENATALRVYDGQEYRTVREFWDAENGVVTWTEAPAPENTLYFVSFCYDEGLLDLDPDDIEWEDFNWDDFEWDGISNAIAVTLEYSDAELIAPEVTVDGDVFTLGDGISLTIALPEDVPEGAVAPTKFHAFFTDLDGGYYGEGDWDDGDVDELPVDAMLDTSWLRADSVYNIALDYAADGTEWKRLNVKRVTVESEPMTLDLNGETDALEILTHQSVEMTVNLPVDATDARLVMEKYYYEEDDDGNLLYTVNEEDEPEYEYENIEDLEDCLDARFWSKELDYGWPERRVLYVEICTDQEDWCRKSNRVTLDIVIDPENPDGVTDECGITLVNDTIAQGEPLEFTLDYGAEDSNIEWLWCFTRHVAEDENGEPIFEDDYPVFDEDEEWNELLEPSSVSVNRPQTAGSIPTANLVPGTYYMQANVVANVPGLWERTQMVKFTVTEPNWNADDFYFTVSPSEGLLAHQEFVVTARKEGAEMIRVLCDDGERVWPLIEWQDGDTLNGTAELGEGSYTLYAQAFMGDDVEEPYVRSDEADNQILEIGVLEGLEDYEIIAPAMAEAGADYTFTVRNLDQANDYWWELRVNRIVPGEDWPEIMYVNSDHLSAGTEQGFVVPEEELVPGHGYEISLWADTRFYGGSEVTARFYVSDQERDDSVRLTAYYDKNVVEPDENGDITVEMPNRAELLLVIEPTGENIPTAYKLYNGNDWDFNDEFDDGRWETTVRPEEDCPIYFASAYYGEIDWEKLEKEGKGWEDLDWSGPSNIVSVTPIYVDAELTPPEVSVKDIENDFTRGDTVEVTIAKPSEDADCGTDFHVYFSDLNGERYESGDWSGDGVELPVTVELRTADLPEDDAYNVMVDYVADGFEWQSVNAGRIYVVGTEDMRFSVTGIEQVGENEYQGRPYQEIRFSAYKAGADHVWVFWDDADADEGDHRFDPFGGGESISDTLREGNEGDYVIYAVAYDRRGTVIDQSEKFTVHLAFDQLDDPEITGETMIDADQDYTFSVTGLETAESDWWWLEVYDEDERDEDGDFASVFDANRNWNAGEEEFTIPADRLQPNHTYWIRVYVNAEGYRGGYDELEFFVRPAAGDHEVTLTVEALNGAMIHRPEDWRITVNAPEAKAVRLRVEGDWHYDDAADIDENGDRVYVGWWFDEIGDHEVYAQALYEDIDENIDWGDVDALNKLNWADISNTETFTVNSLGKAKPALLDREDFEVVRGETLEVELLDYDEADAANPTNFHAYIESEWGGIDDDNVSFDSEEGPRPLALDIPDDLDPEQEYWLVVDACAPDYEWTQTRLPLEICYFQLDEPVVSASPIAEAKEGFTFSVDGLYQQGEDNAWYDIRVYQDGVEYTGDDCAWITTRDDNEPGQDTFTVSDLEPGHAYNLNIWTDAYRYAGNNAEFRFVVYDENQVLTLPAALTDLGDSALDGVAAQLIVLPKGFDLDALGDLSNYPSLLAVVSGEEVIYLD